MSSLVNDIHWLAGFLDGEGCFYFNVNACRVQVVQKDPWPLQRMQQITGGKVMQVKNSRNGLMYFALFLVGRRAAGVMMSVYSLMSPRRQQKIAANLAKWRLVEIRGEVNRNKTHCHRGHEFTGDNLIIKSNGTGRDCRTCMRMHQAKYEAKKKLKLVNS